MSAFGITVSTFFIRFGIIRSCKNKLFLMATCGLFLSINMFEELALRTREATYYSSRKNLADKYLAIYGE